MNIINYSIMTAGKEYFFHGTSSRHIRSILKRGIYFDSSKRHYGDNMGLDESYPGVYFTRNIHKAYESAMGVKRGRENYAIVVVQLEKTSSDIKMDEDDIRQIFSHIRNDYMLQYDPKNIDKCWSVFKQKIGYDDKIINKLHLLFKRAFTYYVLCYKSSYEGYVDNKYFEKLGLTGPSDPDLLKRYRSSEQLFINKLGIFNELLSNNKMSDMRFSKRSHNFKNKTVTDPIAYKGSNRIVMVIEEGIFNHEIVAKVHYCLNDRVRGDIEGIYKYEYPEVLRFI
jgi:hypothetical protein